MNFALTTALLYGVARLFPPASGRKYLPKDLVEDAREWTTHLGTSLTFHLPANNKECFYQYIDANNEHLNVQFQVSWPYILSSAERDALSTTSRCSKAETSILTSSLEIPAEESYLSNWGYSSRAAIHTIQTKKGIMKFVLVMNSVVLRAKWLWLIST